MPSFLVQPGPSVFIFGSLVSKSIAITSVSIQERQDYVIPTYVNDKFGVAHKTLRRPDNIITDEVVNET